MKIISKTIAFIWLILSSGMLQAKSSSDSWLKKLDESLAQKEKYETLKAERIKGLEKLLLNSNSLNTKYDIYKQLFEEYKTNQYDSAVVYANHCLQTANQMKDVNAIAQAKCAVAFCQVSAGIMMEALPQLKSINSQDLRLNIRQQYYEVMAKFWRENADFVHDNPYYDRYIAISNNYMDSLVSILPVHSAKWYSVKGSIAMRKQQFKEAINYFDKAEKMPNRDKHELAMEFAEVAWAYHYLEDKEQELIYFIRSAIYDNETATREITALYLIAMQTYNSGDNERACKYLDIALKDVMSYNSRQRKIEIGTIIPIIEQGRYDAVRKERNWFIIFMVIFAFMSVGILTEFIYIRKKNSKLKQAMNIIETHAQNLNKTNLRLEEANKIKNIYIGKSFFITSQFVKKLQHIFKTIDRNMTIKKYDAVKECVSQETLNKERNEMYNAFDEAFLSLYPNFVEKFNELFDESQRHARKSEHSLTSEMRIFALIRLGINDSERIAQFLDYSVHTVNTYKTRTKNRSLIDNNLFEQKIMEIS